jgi:ankyrin repeat protein
MQERKPLLRRALEKLHIRKRIKEPAPSEKPALSAEKQNQLNYGLLKAARNGDNEEIGRLLKKGASIEATDKNGNTALMHAATYGNTETCAFLLDHGAKLEAKDIFGRTALMCAAENGRTPTCEFLLEKGASIEATDNDGWTALMHAAQNGYTQTCALLIEKGADVNAKIEKGDHKGMTASSIAEAYGNEKTAAFLKSMETLQG